MSKSRARKPVGRRRALNSMHGPTISLCVIARNEEGFIGDCLASAQPFVDEIVVLDTGSADATCEIARRAGALVGTFAWQDNFSAARNAAMDLATSDWILMLDADERLQPASGPALRAFVQSNPRGADCYAPRIENREGGRADDFSISFPNRLFRRRAGLRYSGAVHEDLTSAVDSVRSLGLRLDFIRITHLGYLPDVVLARDKLVRNRQILLRETTAHPDDPLPPYYLGADLLMADQPAEAAEYLRRSLACIGSRTTFLRVDLYARLIAAYSRLNDVERLEAIVAEADRTGALSVNARAAYAQNLVARGLYQTAEHQLLAALAPNQPEENVRKPGAGGWITRLDLARIYERTGDAAAALRQVELGLADPELGDPSDVARTGVRLAIALGDMAALTRCLDAIAPPADDDLEAHLGLLELRSIAGSASVTPGVCGSIDRAIALGDWQSAYDFALAVPGRTLAEAARLLFVARRLQGGGAPEAALNLLGHLHDAQPALPQVHAQLTTVLTDLGRYDDALAANEILQLLLADPDRRAAA